MNHDERVYENPHEFNPYRFLSADGKLDPEVPKPDTLFGFGRRACPGKAFAIHTLTIAMAHILATFNINNPLDANGNAVEPSGEYTSGNIMCVRVLCVSSRQLYNVFQVPPPFQSRLSTAVSSRRRTDKIRYLVRVMYFRSFGCSSLICPACTCTEIKALNRMTSFPIASYSSLPAHLSHGRDPDKLCAPWTRWRPLYAYSATLCRSDSTLDMRSFARTKVASRCVAGCRQSEYTFIEHQDYASRSLQGSSM